MSDPQGAVFGALLRNYRLCAGVTQETLAERARISIDTVSALERGFRLAPHRDTVDLLASALALGPQERARFVAAAARPRTPRASADSAGSGVTGGRPYDNLPHALTRLVGRATELEEIARLLGEHRLITLTGTGGIGKTSTALQVGKSLLDDRSDGVLLIELAPLQDGSLVASTIARVLGLQEVAQAPLLDALVLYLKDKALLLLFDNCEHVIQDAASVADMLLQRCPALRILATSREALRVRGERTFQLPPLGAPSAEAALELAAADATNYGAIELFVDRAHAVDHRFAITDENARLIAEICRRLDGIPLAIELAAARIRMFSAAELARRLDERFGILTGGSRTASPRQQTLWSTIDWSHNLLDERERTLFRRVAAFSGGWTASAAQTVCVDSLLQEREVLDLLMRLVEKSLVVVEFAQDEARYRLLESTHAYALEKLVESGERDMLADRHADWIAGLTIVYREAFNTLPRERWQRSLEPEVDNVRAALSYASSKGDAALSVRILWLARVSNAIASKGTTIRTQAFVLREFLRSIDGIADGQT